MGKFNIFNPSLYPKWDSEYPQEPVRASDGRFYKTKGDLGAVRYTMIECLEGIDAILEAADGAWEHRAHHNYLDSVYDSLKDLQNDLERFHSDKEIEERNEEYRKFKLGRLK